MKTQAISQKIRRFLRAEEAVSALEYAILVGVITAGIGAALVTFTDTITTAIGTIGTDLTTTVGSNEAGDLDPD